ncbi:MAG: PAS domain S-box protein [Terriglobales bacterium]
MLDGNTSAGAPHEERRRAEVLIQCAQVLHSRLDVDTATAALVERVRSLFNAMLVVIFLRESEEFQLAGLAAANDELADAVRARNAREGGCRLAKEVATAVIEEGEPMVVRVPEDTPDLPEYLPGGSELLGAPIQTSRTAGALLVYCGPGNVFGKEDKSLLGAVARFGALAIANSELYATANARARELQQLLEISAELGSIGELSKFLEKFVVRAAEFLRFERAFIALHDGGSCEARWIAENGAAWPLNYPVPRGIAERVYAQREPTWADDITQFIGADLETAAMFKIRQYLAVPLLGPHGPPLGLLVLLDRKDGGPISGEDVRRAKALAAEVAVVLESTQNLHLANQHRRRAEDLMSVALELNSSLRLPQFVRNFTERAAHILGAGVAALALAQRSSLETVVFHDPSGPPDKSVLRRFNMVLTSASAQLTEDIACVSAPEFLGQSLASQLHWRDVTVARLTGAGGDLIGVLCLANRDAELAPANRNLLQALTGHATVALENSRLFTRMEQANRHWIEIFDAISDFIVVHDQSYNVLRVNRSLANFIGVQPSELIGIGMRALIAIADDKDAQPCPFCRADQSASDEYIHPVLERTYLVSTSRIHGALNEGFQTIHVLKDITDRREAERRYRELFDNIQEGLFFSTVDGRFVEVNDALVRMLGYSSREELLQVDILSQLYLVPAERKRFQQAIEKRGVLRNYQEVLRRKDGSLIYALLNAFAVRDAQGRVTQYRGLMLDITELKNFQTELQRERDFSSKILNNTQSLILVADTAGLISYANKRCLQAGGYSPTDLLGRPLVDLVLPTRSEAMSNALKTTLLGQQVDNLELPIVLGDGRVGQFSINLSPMRDEQGNVSSIVVVMTDVSDAVMLKAKLMHTEKMAAVGQLVSGVAHEVNNPLTAVLGFADLLLENPDVPEPAKKDIHVILQEAQRTKQIVQNLLSFARQTPPQRQYVQLNSILRRTLALRSYDFANNDVHVVQSFDDRLPEMLGDSHQLQQVFLNILNNAYDAISETGQPGRIEISTSTRGDFAEISFRDNGKGIAYPDRIFDPFFTTKEVGKGTGLGLSICYGIVREHGGEITFHNNPDGKGATFIVRLPLAGKFQQELGTAAALGAQT